MVLEHFCLETLCTKTTHKVLLHCRSKNKGNPLAIVQIKYNWINLLKNSSTQLTRSLAFSHMLRSGLLLLPSSWLCFSFGTAALWGRPQHSSCVHASPFLVLILMWSWHRLDSWMSTKECTSDIYYPTVCCAGLRDHSLRTGGCLWTWTVTFFSLTINKVPIYLPNERDRCCSSLFFLRLEKGKEMKPWELVNVCKVLL